MILDDCRKKTEAWGASGTFDPFESIYDVSSVACMNSPCIDIFFMQLIFQTTIRSLSCSEIADDAILVARLRKLYDTLDNGTTPATVLVPWFPTPAMIKKLFATKEIYEIVVRAINAREQSGISRNDTLQMLLDAGDEKLVIVGVRRRISFLRRLSNKVFGNSSSWGC